MEFVKNNKVLVICVAMTIFNFAAIFASDFIIDRIVDKVIKKVEDKIPANSPWLNPDKVEPDWGKEVKFNDEWTKQWEKELND